MTCDDRKTAFHLQYICYFLGNRHIFSKSEVAKSRCRAKVAPQILGAVFKQADPDVLSCCYSISDLQFYLCCEVGSNIKQNRWLAIFFFLGEYPIVAGSRQILPVLSKLWSINLLSISIYIWAKVHNWAIGDTFDQKHRTLVCYWDILGHGCISLRLYSFFHQRIVG